MKRSLSAREAKAKSGTRYAADADDDRTAAANTVLSPRQTETSRRTRIGTQRHTCVCPEKGSVHQRFASWYLSLSLNLQTDGDNCLLIAVALCSCTRRAMAASDCNSERGKQSGNERQKVRSHLRSLINRLIAATERKVNYRSFPHSHVPALPSLCSRHALVVLHTHTLSLSLTRQHGCARRARDHCISRPFSLLLLLFAST